jgi:tripeptidyl-peptidase-1
LSQIISATQLSSPNMSAAKLFLVAGLLASGSYASPIQSKSPYAVKDSHFVPSKWRQVAPAPSTHNIDLRIAIKQNSFDDLERHLYEGKSHHIPLIC